MTQPDGTVLKVNVDSNRNRLTVSSGREDRANGYAAVLTARDRNDWAVIALSREQTEKVRDELTALITAYDAQHGPKSTGWEWVEDSIARGNKAAERRAMVALQDHINQMFASAAERMRASGFTNFNIPGGK